MLAVWALSIVGHQAPRRYELGEILFESTDFADQSVSQLGRLSGGIMLSDDRIVLADGMATHLLFVGLNDRQLTKVGRKGEGPGEFKSLRAIGRASPNGVFAGRDAREFYRTADGNTIAPSLSGMFVDGSGRAWLQPYVFPGDEMVRWQVWEINEGDIEAIVEVPASHTVLDAIGDRVLIRTTDDLDVTSAVVRRLKRIS